MAEQPAGERTEEATPKRREEARKRGTVAKSTDLNGALVLFAVVLVLPSAASSFSSGILQAFRSVLGTGRTATGSSDFLRGAWTIAQPCLGALFTILMAAMVVGVLANVAQVGLVLSPQVMAPSLAKINPMEGFKRLFSIRVGMEGLKAFAKSFVFGFIAFQAVVSAWPQIIGIGWLQPASAAVSVGGLIHQILLRVAGAWLVVAVADYLFQRKQVDKQLKMTKDELKREMKENEASPELKSERYRRQRKLLKGRMMDQVKKADVVITNPTHYAVAIQYDRSKMHAPMVVAKGADYLALKIREVAAAEKVPIVPNPPLARRLYRKCDVGDFVPREMFQAVAEVLAYVYQTLRKVR